LEFPIDSYVLGSALSQLVAWRASGRHDVRFMAVNAAPALLCRDDFADVVLAALDIERLPTSVLSIEVTENALMADPKAARRTLHRLAGAGIQISLDDFCTGYSSLAYLREFPVHTVKLDRSFVSSIDSSPSDRDLVAAIVAMARSLDKMVVAEGVETERHAEILLELGAHFAQGYLYSRAVPPDELPTEFPHVVRHP